MLFVLGYQIFLKNNTRFNLSRFYLIASILLSFLIPSLPVDLGIGSMFTKDVKYVLPTEIKVLEQNITTEVTQTTATSSFNLMDIDFVKIIGIALLSISVLLFIRFIFRFGSIILIQNTGNRLESEDGLNLIFTDKTDNAFSFHKYIFINPLKFTDEEKRLIIEHEREHIRHFHSIDLILIELLIVFQWFNPFAYTTRRKLIEIHEFIADNGVIRNGADPYSYQNLLLSVVTSSCLPTVGNQLSALITKKRIAMIGKPMNQTGRWINFLVIIPIVVLLIVGVSAFTPSKPSEKGLETRNTISSVQNDTTSFNDLMSKAKLEVKDTWLKEFKVSLAPDNSQNFNVILKKACIYNFYIISNNNEEKLGFKIYYNKSEKEKVVVADNNQKYSMISFNPSKDGSFNLVIYNPSANRKSNAILVFTLHEMKEIVQSGMEEIVVTARKSDISDEVRAEVLKKDKQEVKETEETKEVKDLNEEQVFMVVEQMPKFGNNDDDFRIWVAQNMKYPLEAAAKGIQGRVFVQFVVEKDGSITNAKVLRGVDPSLDKEAIRVIMKSPKWNPGKQRGQAVRVSNTLPITFVLQ